MPIQPRFAHWLSDIDTHEGHVVGTKAIQLAQLYQESFPMLDGFVITTHAYRTFLHENNLPTKIAHLLNTATFSNHDSILQVARHIKKTIEESPLSKQLSLEIKKSYTKLAGQDKVQMTLSFDETTPLPMDTPVSLSFVQGDTNILMAIRSLWASLFNIDTLLYHHKKKTDFFQGNVGIIVQKALAPTASGVIYTSDEKDKQTMVIDALYGTLIQPYRKHPHDRYIITKSDNTVILRDIVHQHTSYEGNQPLPLDEKKGSSQKIDDTLLVALSQLGKKVEKHMYFPQIITFVTHESTPWITNISPLTPSLAETTAPTHNEPLVKGTGIHPGLVIGKARVILDEKDFAHVKPGEIIVAKYTTVLHEVHIKNAKALIVEKEGHETHTALFAKTKGVPTIIAVQKATRLIKTGMVITVHAKEGVVFKGHAIIEASSNVPQQKSIKTATKIFSSVASPNEDITQADGVFLDGDFLIQSLPSHPKSLLEKDKGKEIVTHIAQVIEQIAEKNQKHPLFYCFSDQRVDMMRSLPHGTFFELHEGNPLLGFHGAARMVYEPHMLLCEIEALKYARNKKGIRSLSFVIPYARSANELLEVKRFLASHGLHRSGSTKLYITIDTPAQALSVSSYLDVGIDGVILRIQNLTTLLLGVDPSNNDVAPLFDQTHDVVVSTVEHVLKTVNKHHVATYLTSNVWVHNPSLLGKMIRRGITGILTSSQEIETARNTIRTIEHELIR